jgi:hypothetical protein
MMYHAQRLCSDVREIYRRVPFRVDLAYYRAVFSTTKVFAGTGWGGGEEVV